MNYELYCDFFFNSNYELHCELFVVSSKVLF